MQDEYTRYNSNPKDFELAPSVNKEITVLSKFPVAGNINIIIWSRGSHRDKRRAAKNSSRKIWNNVSRVPEFLCKLRLRSVCGSRGNCVIRRDNCAKLIPTASLPRKLYGRPRIGPLINISSGYRGRFPVPRPLGGRHPIGSASMFRLVWLVVRPETAAVALNPSS